MYVFTFKIYLPGVSKRLVNFSGLKHSYFLDFSQCFGLFYTINYGRFFILVLLGHEIENNLYLNHAK